MIVDSFDLSRDDEFTREQYQALAEEVANEQRLDAPFSFEPMQQTLMRMILQARKKAAQHES